MTLGIAVLGTGRIAGNAFVPAVARTDGAEMVAVPSRDQARGEVFAAEHGIASAYSDPVQLLDDKSVDAVIIASPDACMKPR